MVTPRPLRPAIDPEVTGDELDPHTRTTIRSLGSLARPVSRHLVMAGRMLDDDPELAHQHAQEARRLAGRLAVVREAAGTAAYRAGHYDVALAEFRAARRMSGEPEVLPAIADCLRALGRHDDALAVGADPDVDRLSPEASVELALVLAGTLRDLGRLDEALTRIEAADLEPAGRPHATLARLWYGYADLLAELGRRQDAVAWFTAAANHDVEGELDAEERLAALTQDDAHGAGPVGDEGGPPAGGRRRLDPSDSGAP
jgi:tetratricopeptide (TPR) repeat protein